jgi:hypothetical protein
MGDQLVVDNGIEYEYVLIETLDIRFEINPGIYVSIEQDGDGQTADWDNLDKIKENMKCTLKTLTRFLESLSKTLGT